MTKRFLLTAALTLMSLPVFAQTTPNPKTPPEAFSAAKTIQFTATELLGGVPVKVSIALLAVPNKAYVVDTDVKTKIVETIYASDGKMQTEYRHSRGTYTKSDAPAKMSDIASRTVGLSTLTDFLDPAAFAQFHHRESDAPNMYRKLLGKQEGQTIEEILTVNPATGLPKSVSIVITPSKRPGRPAEQVIFTGWKLNTPINNSKFAYMPPVDAKLYVAPKLLANGTSAPDFTAQDKDGKAVRLSDYRGKTVVLDFWATWCGPCQSSFPHTAEIARQYAGKNVVVLAVNVWDTPQAFHAWLPKHPEFAALNFAVDPSASQDKGIATALYGVSGIPTQYVIDPSGKIIKSIVGYEPGDTQLEDALKASGG